MTRQGDRAPKTSTAETRLSLHIQPGAKRSEVVSLANGVLRVRVAAPAKEGRANEALVALLASALGVPKTRIRVVRGLATRNKVVAVQGLSQEEALRRLGAVYPSALSSTL